MSDYDLPIEWTPEPNEADEPTPLPFVEGISVTRWDFEDGSYLELQKNEGHGYLFSGNIGGKSIHDGDYEDIHFANTDELLTYFEKYGLLKLLSDKLP